MLRNIHGSLFLFIAFLILVGLTSSLPPVRAALNHTSAGGDTRQNGTQAEPFKRDGSVKSKAQGSFDARSSRITTRATGTSGGMEVDAAGNAISNDLVVTGQGGKAISNAATLAVCAPPALGNYTAMAITVGGNGTVVPDAAPSNASGLTAIAPTDFTGTLTVNPTIGAVNIANAGPVGSYVVKVYALSNCTSPVIHTFTLTVNASAVCSSASFASPMLYATAGAGSVPFAVAAGDFNGDGKTDLAAANNGASVGILLNDGAGGFTAATGSPISTGQNSPAIAIATGDFNGDGKLDLAVGDGIGNINILLGDGHGGFVLAPGVPFSTSTFIFSLATGDFNGDGKLDITATNFETNDVTILLGDGSGGLQRRLRLAH